MDEKNTFQEDSEWKRHSEIIFTAVSNGNFKNFKEAETMVTMAYVPDLSFSRAGISHALKKLQEFYLQESIGEKIDCLKQEAEKHTTTSFYVTGWTNFCRVFKLPKVYPNSHCPINGLPVTFTMVDWFNPVQGIGQPAVSKDCWVQKFGNLDGMEGYTTVQELRQELVPFLMQKNYVKIGRRYLVICDFGATFVFDGLADPEL